MSKSKEKLFTDFPPVTTEEWMERVAVDLKGADFERRLVWKTNEGFNLNPFYRSEDIQNYEWRDNLPGEFPYVRGTKTDNIWYVRQDINVTDIAEANKKALTLLEKKGVTSLGFDLSSQKLTAQNIESLLQGIHPEKVELNFKTCINSTLKLTKLLVEYLTAKDLNLLECYGSIEHDPFRKIFKLGKDAPEWKNEVVEIVKASAPLPRYRVISITGDAFANAGAYLFQELGYSLAYANQILSTLIENGVDPSMAAKKIKFNLGVGTNYFMEIAKFRAARWLWAEIVNAYKPPCPNECDNKADDGTCRCAAKINVHAITSSFNTTVYDAYVNLLRTQTEAMSATLGGVDSLTVQPFNHAYQKATDFSNRLAVNQQLLLKEESHFDKVADPGAGSYYIEKLTKSLGEEAWKLFLETDEQGFYAGLKEGTIQDKINASADARFKAAASRKEVLLGTNQFPNFGEQVSTKIEDSYKLDDPCGCGSDSKETPLKRLNTKRLAQPFEAVRLATEQSGKTPKAFMLTIGNLTMRLARSQFSGNFLASAGYDIIDNLGFDSVEEGVKAARKQNADLIVLCSSDDEYAKFAPEAYNLTKGKEILIIAGAPASADELKAQGIEYFINVKSNVLDMLTQFNSLLGIKGL